MNFQEAESYLLSLGNEVETMKLGLDNIRRLLVALGNPEKKYLKVQVAGTNGKGSVCAFLDSICTQAGIRTGVFISPHLMSIIERVRISGTDILEKEFARFATIVRETSERLVSNGELDAIPTYFEQVTAIALLAFVEANVELAILETGLGGRYDATTAANAEISAFTRIDLDHQEYLGETIIEIATEKAAIIRSDSMVFVAPQEKAVERVIRGHSRSVGVEPVWVNEDYKVNRDTDDYLNTVFRTQKNTYFVKLFMFGRHQFANAATALAVAECLGDFGFEIQPEAIDAGLGSATNPGRLEYIGQFLLDGAHNLGGVRALRTYLDEFIERPIILIFGAMKDKDVGDIAEILFSKADKIILTQPSNSRAMPVEQLAKFVPAKIGVDRVLQSSSVPDALIKAKALAPENGIILVTGSLYLVGEVRKILTRQGE